RPAVGRGAGSAGDYGSDFCGFIFGSLQLLPTFGSVKLFRRLDYPMEILVLVVRPDFSKRAEPSVRGRVESQCRNFGWGRLNDGNWERHFFAIVEGSLTVIYDRNVSRSCLEAGEAQETSRTFIFWPIADPRGPMAGASAWKVCERSSSGSAILPVSHLA